MNEAMGNIKNEKNVGGLIDFRVKQGCFVLYL